MGKPIGGPSWEDIEGLLRAIDALHGGTTGVMLTPRGIGATGGFQVAVVSSFASAGPGGSEGLVTESSWPCVEGCALETHIFGGLYKHDSALGNLWRQAQLPF